MGYVVVAIFRKYFDLNWLSYGLEDLSVFIQRLWISHHVSGAY